MVLNFNVFVTCPGFCCVGILTYFASSDQGGFVPQRQDRQEINCSRLSSRKRVLALAASGGCFVLFKLLWQKVLG